MDIYATTCPCTCHEGGPHTPCRIPGGCGHLHDEHRCRRGDRCADWVWIDMYDPDTGDVALGRAGALINAPGLCPRCIVHAETVLTELPRDYTELALIVGRGTSYAGGEPVAGSPELPIPVRTEIEAVQAAMVAEATCWAEAVADPLGIDWNSYLVDHHTRPGAALQRATRLLSRALSPLLAVRGWTRMVWAADGWTAVPEDRDGVDGLITLVELHHQARRLCGVTRVVWRKPVPCGRCGRRTLVRDDGADDVYCTYCGHIYPDTDYATYTSVLAAAFAADPPAAA